MIVFRVKGIILWDVEDRKVPSSMSPDRVLNRMKQAVIDFILCRDTTKDTTIDTTTNKMWDTTMDILCDTTRDASMVGRMSCGRDDSPSFF